MDQGCREHTAGDRIQYTFDYTSWLATSEQLTDVTVTPVNYALATIDTVAISATGKKVTFYLTGGSADDRFELAIEATTSLGQIRQDTLRIHVNVNGCPFVYSASLLGPTGPTGAGDTGATGPTGLAVSGFWPTAAMSTPPVASAWTQHNFSGSTTLVDATEGVPIVRLRTPAPGNTSYNFRSALKAAPTPSWNLIGRFRRQQAVVVDATVKHCLGLAMYESATGKNVVFGPGGNSSSSVSIVRKGFTSDTVEGAGTAGNYEVWGNAGLSDVPWDWWCKINYDGTTLTYYFSNDGWVWNTVASELVTAVFTAAPNFVGFGMIDGWRVTGTKGGSQEIILDCAGWSCS